MIRRIIAEAAAIRIREMIFAITPLDIGHLERASERNPGDSSSFQSFERDVQHPSWITACSRYF